MTHAERLAQPNVPNMKRCSSRSTAVAATEFNVIVIISSITTLPEDDIPAEIEAMIRCKDNAEVAVRGSEGYTAANDMEEVVGDRL